MNEEKILKLLESIAGDIGGLKTDVADLKKGQFTLEDRIGTLEYKVDKIDASQVRMEKELTEKVRALFDAREVQKDVNERIISTLDRIEAKVDVLQLETASIRRIK